MAVDIKKLERADFHLNDDGVYERLVEKGDSLFEPLKECPCCHYRIVGYLEKVTPEGDISVKVVCPSQCDVFLPVKPPQEQEKLNWYAIEYSIGNDSLPYFNRNKAQYTVKKARSATSAKFALDEDLLKYEEQQTVFPIFNRVEEFETKEMAESRAKDMAKDTQYTRNYAR